MKKSAKEAFGVFQDGQILRIVHLRRDQDQLYLLGMDSVQMEQDWYKGDQARAASDAEFIPLDAQLSNVDDLDFSDLGSGGESYEMSDLPQQGRMEVSPITLMLSRYSLGDGVISLNVHDPHIIKDEPGKVKKAEIARFRKANLDKAARKAGAWQSCVVEAEEGPQHWLHTGPNLLLDALINYGRESNTKLYFQLADANDMVLTEFYRYSLGETPSGINLFAYLGTEYRKLFVFRDGKWIQSLDIHITQEYPDADIIYSKIALAIDSAQLGEPESIVLAGDLAGVNLIEYMNSQSMSTKTTLLNFPNLVVAGADNYEYSNQVLEQYSLAIALAYKALFHENEHFSACTFLPSRIIDNQKELRVVWHGFIVLSLIFALVLYATINYLRFAQDTRREEENKLNLTLTLNQLRAENAVVEKLQSEITSFRDLNSNVVGVLKDKNRWTELFDIINATFSSHRDSWITNLKQDGEKLSITGTTSRRDYVSRLAEGLPDCKINSVSQDQIRNRDVWNFQMELSLPELNWEDIIMAEFVMPDTVAQKQQSSTSYRQYRPKKATSSNGKIKSNGNGKKSYRYAVLPYMRNDYTPGPNSDELNYDSEMNESYLRFVEAIEKGNQLEYRFTGHMILEKYPDSELASLVRWWVAYRLYLDLEYRLARETLRANLNKSGEYLPYSKLLDARLSFALAESEFKDKYNQIISKHPGTPAAKQAALDIKTIEGEYTR